MFYKQFLYILLITTIILTCFVCITKPKMHTNLLIYNSDYKIVSYDNNEVKTKTNIQVKSSQNTPKKETKVTNNVEKVQISNKNKKIVKKQNQKINIPITKQINAINNTKTTKITQLPKPTNSSKSIKTIQNNNIQKQTKSIQEEEIAWNKWRSNIQNQIMKDTKLPILPQGTVFKFSFDVDKFGKVTNVQTWSETPTYTPYAIQNIAPVIRSYQGKYILNFPEGSNRVMTTVYGQWKISNNQKYSTSANFNDIETIKREK